MEKFVVCKQRFIGPSGKFECTVNEIYKLLVDNDKYQIENKRSIPPRYDYIDKNDIENFDELIDIDQAKSILKNQLTLFTKDFFETRNSKQENSGNVVYHIKYHDDLITIKFMQDDKYMKHHKFHVKIRSNNNTHEHSFADVMTSEAIMYLCNFIKFICGEGE